MRLVVLASGEGTNLQAVIDAVASGRLPAEIAAVVSQRRGAGALARADAADISTAWVPFGPYKDTGRSREDYDADLAQLVATFAPDWVVCLGWMHVLSRAFLDRFPERVINLHPALPGEIPGKDAIAVAWAQARAGERRRTGVMVHLVVPEVDAGPVLSSVEVPIRPDETLDGLAERVHAAEHELIVDVLVALSGRAGLAEA